MATVSSWNGTWCELVYLGGNQTTTMTTTDMKMAFTVVLMAILGALLSAMGLHRLFVGRQARLMVLGRYDLCSYVPILMHSTFVLFLPLLSSVFSQTEANGTEDRLFLVLLWMLLVELIRKKVQVMVLPTDGSSFSRGTGRFSLTDYSDEVARLVWVGYLIYANMDALKPAALEAMFVILWSLSLFKLVQRAVNTWMASHSWQTAMNPLLIAGYMQHLVDDEKHSPTLTGIANCKYVVMGEHKLVPKVKEKPKVVTTSLYGYGVGKHVVPHETQTPAYCDQNEQKHFNLLIDLDVLDPNKTAENKKFVTVNKAWAQAGEVFSDERRKHYLQNLCLSFSLFKMLRRRFEHYPMTELGSKMAREVMLDGQLTPDRTIQVLQLELDFLEHYYLAPVPMVMAQPILFFGNFACSMIFNLTYSLATCWILVSNYVASRYCHQINFRFLDVAITFSLVVTLEAIEVTEFCNVYLFSHWTIVRLLCLYDQWGSPGRVFIRWFLAVRCWFSHGLLDFISCILRVPNSAHMKIKQVSIVDNCWPIDKYSARVSEVQLAAKAKVDIVDSLKRVIIISPSTGGISLGPKLLRLYWAQWGELQSKMTGLAGRGKTATEVILAFHLVTELLEIKNHGEGKNKLPEDSNDLANENKTVAITLSRYCMYLVAHMPALLPDDEAWVSARYEETRSCLEHVSRRCCGMMCTWRHHCRKEMAETIEKEQEELEDPETRVAVKLFRELEGESVTGIWKDLASLWVELVVYVAPSNDVQGHAKVLASSGGDLLTCLWAFCTHAGITREPLELGDADTP